jgi:hypothetical protein
MTGTQSPSGSPQVNPGPGDISENNIPCPEPHEKEFHCPLTLNLFFLALTPLQISLSTDFIFTPKLPMKFHA